MQLPYFVLSLAGFASNPFATLLGSAWATLNAFDAENSLKDFVSC